KRYATAWIGNDRLSAGSPRSGVAKPGARLTATPMPHGAWPAAIGWTRSPAPGVAAPGTVPDVDDDAARLVAGGDRLGETAQLRRGGPCRRADLDDNASRLR